MASYTLQPVDGTQFLTVKNKGDLYHDLAIRASGTPSGSLVLTARKAGSDVYEEIPDGTFDLSALNSIQFTGGVSQYKVDITGISGVHALHLTDTAQRA